MSIGNILKIHSTLNQDTFYIHDDGALIPCTKQSGPTKSFRHIGFDLIPVFFAVKANILLIS